MTVNDVTDIIVALPEAAAIGNKTYWRKVIPSLVSSILDEITNAYDFDFTLAEYSDVVTVADQADYTIKGSNKNCRDVVSIRYDTDKLLLDKYRVLDMDVLISNDDTGSGVNSWYQATRSDDGYPIITLVNTPDVAGKVLYIRFRRNDVTLDKFPEGFAYVVAQGVLAWVQSARRPLFDRALKHMIRRYRAGGKDVQTVSFSPHMVKTNRDISDLYGVG